MPQSRNRLPLKKFLNPPISLLADPCSPPSASSSWAQLFWIYLANRRAANRDELFRIITENAADLIALVDTKSHRLYNSPSYQRILSYSLAELAHTPILEQIRPADRFKVLEAAREARATGVGKSLQYRLRHKNGWAISHRIFQLIWLHKGIRYEERDPAVSEQSKRVRTVRMIGTLRKLVDWIALKHPNGTH
jgi:PAS domain S-box-containing protein